MIFSTGLLLCITGSSSSSSHLCLQVIFITGSGSSLDLDLHRTSSLDLDHYSIWIIMTGLDLDHHSIWIIITRQYLDHHSICIINAGSRSSLDLDQHWCYLMILLVIGSSTDPALFHASCRPRFNVGLPLHIKSFFILGVAL